MATQSKTPSDDKTQNQDSELLKPVDEKAQDVAGDTLNQSSERTFFAMPTEPMREDQVQNAVNFLSHPKVKSSPVVYRRSFLERKGLTKEEIDEAFRRVPDPPSNVTNVEAATTNHAAGTKSTTGLKPQDPVQAPQSVGPPVSVVSMVPNLQRPTFHWSHAFLAVGVLAASGAGSVAIFKNMFVPRLKTWIRNVVAEKNETDEKSTVSKETVEAAKVVESAAAVAAKASQELLSAKDEERKYFVALTSMIDVQVKEMKSMGEAIRKLASTRETTDSHDKMAEEHYHSSTGNGKANNLWGTTQINQSDALLPSKSLQQVKVNGTRNPEFGEVRPSSAPASMEPPPHPKSYMEIMAMIERGEKPPGIKEINDMPPNPNQQPSNPRLAPRAKPWEAPQQRPNNNDLTQDSFPSSQPNGRAHDDSEPWWRKKTVQITEIEQETEEPKESKYSIGATERAPRRGWVPPQPPSVVMPGAAAAIRQPKPSVQQQQQPADDRSADDGEGGGTRVADSTVDVSIGNEVVNMNPSEIQEEEEEGRADGIEAV